MDQEQKLRNSFAKIKEELNDHLEAINSNTNEIQANYEYFEKLENKIDKLNEKLEELLVSKTEERQEKAEEIKNIKLTIREQEVFLTIYTSTEFLSYTDIARKLGLTDALVRTYITNLIEKGVPIVKRYINNQAEIQLEPWFKELQAKENLLEINARVAREYSYS